MGRRRERVRAALRRLRSAERREVGEFLRWVENTDNLVHLSVLVFVPLLIGLVTLLSNAVEALPYLLFPPLASGAYTLFVRPESRYASPRRFVGGITLGALCGWIAFIAAERLFPAAPAFTVPPAAAAGAIALTAIVTWALDLEEPSAFSSALLVLVVEMGTGVITLRPLSLLVIRLSPRSAYVLSVLLSTALVAAAFVVWDKTFYERRATYLYGTTHGDDHVLVPMRGDDGVETATMAARIAAAHDAGKVVLLDVLEGVDPDVLAAHRGEGDPAAVDEAGAERVRKAVERLDETATRLREATGVSCEVIVASGDPASTTLDTADRANCDLVVTPYETEDGALSPYVRRVLSGPVDAVAHRSTGAADWRRVMVPVARPGDTAHAMVDFATRLAGDDGRVSVCTCIGTENARRGAEHRLANVVEAFDAPVETRVARAEITAYIQENAKAYDLVMLGSSGERSTASRLISPPTFRQLRDVDCDVAVVDRGEAGR
ncbi:MULTISPECIES: universal stress protein [Halolamina]|uniref:Nucleotide-binding universal stress protein, UspA family n=1 Tax=Halolamina pelagica TaxID=699431 RepID=A0A1I5TIJ0_9EURY|nr:MULTISPECIES: universal stress protein [Halolamina]NHX37353.1 universal stress protein [Halolamina sp. R1-12]SFP82467.1 Nucleotide-binding universal stress protein, UspA family [Halolamina pelagica]